MQPRYCERINPANGETEKRLRLPPLPGNSDPQWGWIGISDDVLLAASTPIALNLEGGKREKGQETSKIAKRVATSDMSIALVAFQRESGKPLWSRSASLAFQHDAIVMGSGKIFCIDGLRRFQNDLLKNQGIFIAAAPTLYALDAKTGETIWQKPVDDHADQLAYSKDRDVLLHFSLESEGVAGEKSSKLKAYDGSDGVLLWEKADQLKSRPVLCGGQAFLDGAMIDIATGESAVWKDPIEKAERKFNLDSIWDDTIATSDLLFSGNGECIDLQARDGLLLPRLNAIEDIEGNIVGGGVLAVATESRIHAFGSRTGLPDWRYQLFQGLTSSVQRVGINFGAAGDRGDTDGMLWLEKPAINGRDPGLEVLIENENARFYREPSDSDNKLGWIGSSGVINPGAIEIKLDYSPLSAEKVYRVKLFFQTPPSQKESYTTFDVLVQGEKVLSNLDVAWQAGGAVKLLVKEFAEIEAEESIRIELVPHRGEPFISGIALER